MPLWILIALALSFCLHTPALAQPPGGGRARGPQMPDAPGRDVTQKVCGATCHGPDVILGKGRTRDQWTAVVNSMVTRGAKASETELVQIVEYLSTNMGPNSSPAPGGPGGGRPGPGAPRMAAGRGPGPLGAGAADSHIVDDAAADRGKAVYIAECITCHGPKTRGGNSNLPRNQQGPDLIRSLIVLRDRYGNKIGPFLAKHPLQSGRPAASLKVEQVADLAHFLHQRVYYTLRSGPELKVQNILTGDRKAGEAYFNGAGKCNTCHSVSGDLKGIGRRYDPPTLQSKFLFPRSVGFSRGGAAPVSSKPVTVTVTQANGEKVEGTLIALDDFNVSLRDSQNNYRSFRITPELKVVKNDPAAMHVSLLDQYTDKNMHDIVAYLESLK